MMFEIIKVIENRITARFVVFFMQRYRNKPFIEIALKDKITVFSVENELLNCHEQAGRRKYNCVYIRPP